MYEAFKEFQNRDSRKINIILKGVSEINDDVSAITDLVKRQLSIISDLEIFKTSTISEIECGNICCCQINM